MLQLVSWQPELACKSVHFNPQVCEAGSWTVPFVVRNQDPQHLAYAVQDSERLPALHRVRWCHNNKVIQIMPDQWNTGLMQMLAECISHCIKYLWHRSEAEWQHRVNVQMPIPLHGQEGAVVGVDGNKPICRFNVYFGKECPWAKPCHQAHTVEYERESREPDQSRR